MKSYRTNKMVNSLPLRRSDQKEKPKTEKREMQVEIGAEKKEENQENAA